jgi:hypothetical protein
MSSKDLKRAFHVQVKFESRVCNQIATRWRMVKKQSNKRIIPFSKTILFFNNQIPQVVLLEISLQANIWNLPYTISHNCRNSNSNISYQSKTFKIYTHACTWTWDTSMNNGHGVPMPNDSLLQFSFSKIQGKSLGSWCLVWKQLTKWMDLQKASWYFTLDKKTKKKLYLIILFDILYVCERECDLFIRLIKPIYVLYRYFLADVQIKTVISIVSSRKKLYAFDVGRPSVQIWGVTRLR